MGRIFFFNSPKNILVTTCMCGVLNLMRVLCLAAAHIQNIFMRTPGQVKYHTKTNNNNNNHYLLMRLGCAFFFFSICDFLDGGQICFV